jgi:DNA-binding winged helix-turn-helix (wHTH) protein
VKIVRVAPLLRGTQERLRFGRFELWTDRQQLLIDGRPCRIGGRALDLLTVLAENVNRTVSRSELIDRVWPDLAVEPNNLQVQICALRKILGARTIVTVPRRGYRLVATIKTFVRVSPDAVIPKSSTRPDLPSVVGDTLRERLRWRSRTS